MSDEIIVKLKITREGFDEHFSIDEWFNFGELSQKDLYNKMLHFVVDADGNPITPDEARKLFKKIPKRDWSQYTADFYKAITEAFVSPTSGGG